jgi:hypothetical protein
VEAVKRETVALGARINELKALREELRQLVAEAERAGAHESDYCHLIEGHRTGV